MRISLRSTAFFTGFLLLGIFVQMILCKCFGVFGTTLQFTFVLAALAGAFVLDNYVRKIEA